MYFFRKLFILMMISLWFLFFLFPQKRAYFSFMHPHIQIEYPIFRFVMLFMCICSSWFTLNVCFHFIIFFNGNCIDNHCYLYELSSKCNDGISRKNIWPISLSKWNSYNLIKWLPCILLLNICFVICHHTIHKFISR